MESKKKNYAKVTHTDSFGKLTTSENLYKIRYQPNDLQT